MDTALVKFLIIWIMCENIMLTTSMALKEIANEDANTRQKRSPASLFGFNPVSAARESFTSIGNIFSGISGNTQHNNYHVPIQLEQSYERNTNTLSPISIPNSSGIPNSMAQDDFQNGDRYVWQQENKNEGFMLPPISIPNRSGIPNSMAQDEFQKGDRYIPQENKSEGFKKTVLDQKQKPVPARNIEAPENAGDTPGNGNIDKQILDDIFQKPEFNYDDAGTTVDNNIDFVTETGEYETTTGLDQRMLPAAAVASLLG